MSKTAQTGVSADGGMAPGAAGSLRPWVWRWAVATIAAWLVFAIVDLAVFAREPVPVAYLGRPLIVAGIVAGLIGLASLLARRFATPVAAAFAVFVALASPIVALIVLAALLTARLARMLHLRVRIDATEATYVPLGVLLALTLFQAWSAVDLSEYEIGTLEDSGPRIIVILLDGYPRDDTLAALGLGIENATFQTELADRGFDLYQSTSTVYSYTNKTLLAMLDDPHLEDGDTSVSEKRAIREELEVPRGYLAISPPMGHVTLNGGPKIDPNVINDFEVHLVGLSFAGQLATDWSGWLVMEALRQNEEQALLAIESTDARRVFAHILVPHPPFLYSLDGAPLPAPACWPHACNLFDSTIERLGISRTAWASGMAGQIADLNTRLLALVESSIDLDPDAVIVLFSDHGGRYSSAEPEEWHYSFLAARTPDHPNLFGRAGGPEPIFRILDETYGKP